MNAGRTLEGAGCVTWWGFGPARDLFETGVPRPHGELNVLLVGSGDPRHILKTITGLADGDSLRVWVMENSMDVVARQLLLLYVALIAPEDMGTQEKTEVFLELFGNSKIRTHTDNTLKHIAARLSHVITDTPDADTHAHPCLDTSLLKFKERDELVRIFKQWRSPPSTPFGMCKAWDARVRQHLGSRYDARRGCFDWDLCMKLHDRGCGVIHKLQYSKWRESGVAFEMREGHYCVANQSLLSTRVFSRSGERVGLRGYWGDIVSSPYLSFGIETENKELLRMQNNQHIKTAQDISVANLQTLFKSLSTRGGRAPVSELREDAAETPSQPDPSLSGQETRQTDEKQTSAEDPKGPESETHAHELMNLNGISVTFLSPDSLPNLSMKSRYSRLFNAIYCSASMVHHLDSSLKQTAVPDAVLIIELARYLLDLSKEQETAFAARINEIVKELGFVSAPTRDNDAYAVFTLQKST